jgi:cytochrome P450
MRLSPLFDPGFVADPAAWWRALRGRCPVVPVTLPAGSPPWQVPGHFVLTGRREVIDALADDATFSVPRPTMLTVLGGVQQFPNIEHKRFRALLRPFFTTGALKELEPVLREQAAAMIDELVGVGRCEVIADLAIPYPRQAFVTVWGLPPDDHEKIIRFNAIFDEASTGTASPNPQDELIICEWALAAISYSLGRRGGPGILSKLLSGDVGVDEAFALLIIMLNNSGFGSTTAAIGFALLELAQQPDLRRSLRENPKQVKGFVDNVLRLRPSLETVYRTVTRDITVAGVTMPRGSRVELGLGAINRDQDDNTSGDLDCVRRPQWGFGGGRYRCPGATLAQMELKLIVQEWLRRIPDFELDADSVPAAKLHRRFRMPSSVPLRWTPPRAHR